MPVRIRASPRRYSRKLFTPFLLSFPPLPLPSPPIARPAGGRRKNRTLLSPLCSSFSLVFSEFSRSRYTCIGVLFVGFVQFFNCSRLYYNYSASNSCAKARKFRWNVGEKREREREIAWKKDHAAGERTRVKGSRDFSSSRLAIRIAFPAIPSVRPVKQAFRSTRRSIVLPPPPGRMNTFATFRRPLERRRLAAAQRGNNKDA